MAVHKKFPALGRGLDALISTDDVRTDGSSSISEVPLDRIKANPNQPRRDFTPETMEEQLICFADKFYSKTKLDKEKPIEKVRKSLAKYGEETVERFDNWCKLFLGE